MSTLAAMQVKRVMQKTPISTFRVLKSNSNLVAKRHISSRSDEEIPEPPTTCCNSGCDSCVWIEYAEELVKKYKNGGKVARETIMEKVKDPSMKAFLLAELKDIEGTS